MSPLLLSCHQATSRLEKHKRPALHARPLVKIVRPGRVTRASLRLVGIERGLTVDAADAAGRHLIEMSPSALSLAGVDGAEYAQSWLVQDTA